MYQRDATTQRALLASLYSSAINIMVVNLHSVGMHRILY